MAQYGNDTHAAANHTATASLDPTDEDIALDWKTEAEMQEAYANDLKAERDRLLERVKELEARLGD